MANKPAQPITKINEYTKSEENRASDATARVRAHEYARARKLNEDTHIHIRVRTQTLYLLKKRSRSLDGAHFTLPGQGYAVRATPIT